VASPTVPRPTRGSHYGPTVRAVWIVAIVLIVVGLGAWGTTCTGERPRPTGETIPAGVTTTAGLAPATEPPGG
jgi:hypothetical protein